MKNPFRKWKKEKPDGQAAQPFSAEPLQETPGPEETQDKPTPPDPPDDDFVEWLRSRTRGGIERRERNDIYEMYNVYGADRDGHLICRCYHRYPEHDREFGLSYSRTLRFDEFNRRLLGELDKGDLRLTEYNDCIQKAEALTETDTGKTPFGCEELSPSEAEAIRLFCEALDTLKEKSYLHTDGVLRCECESAVDSVRLNLRFRRPIRYDALFSETAGVKKEPIGGYDIDDLWVMSVYNRVYERCSSCRALRLTSEWSVGRETLYLIRAQDFSGIEGALLITVGEAESFRRFGFYSLDFSTK